MSSELSIADGRFSLERLAGRGASSNVWRGRDNDSGQVVALKIAANAESASLLAHEAEVLDQVCCSNAPGFVQLGRTDIPVGDTPEGAVFLAESWADGSALKTKGFRSAHERRRVGCVVAACIGQTLAELHESGLAHGDVKPSNILVALEANRASLIDFGFATSIQSGAIRGATLRYLAPEAREGRGSPRSWDLWALGVVLAEIASPSVAGARSLDSLAVFSELPEPFRSWCRALTAADPGSRPSALWLASRAVEELGDSARFGVSRHNAVRASYLRVRREEIRRAANSTSVTFGVGVCEWLRPALALRREVDAICGHGALSHEPANISQFTDEQRAHWLVCLVGTAAACWNLSGTIAGASEDVLAAALERLAGISPPEAWTLADVARVLDNASPASSFESSLPGDDLDLALALCRRPTNVHVLALAERRAADNQLGERQIVLLADALRLRAETGRALACVDLAHGDEAGALRAELLRRAGRRDEAMGVGLKIMESQNQGAKSRASSVVARLRFDQGKYRDAIELAQGQRTAWACETRALAHLERGEHEQAIQALSQGRALCDDEESMARLDCVQGMVAHARGESQLAYSEFSRATEHASRAGALIEEATYRTGMASAAADSGWIGQALDASHRACLMWEQLARLGQWAHALLSRAAAFHLAGAMADAVMAAEQACELGRQAGDAKAQAYALMTIADASGIGTELAAGAAQKAQQVLGETACPEDQLRAAARLLLHTSTTSSEQLVQLDRLSRTTGMSPTAQCEWWTSRAQVLRAKRDQGRGADILAELARLVRTPCPAACKGVALNEGRMLAMSLGDGQTARLIASAQASMASVVIGNAPASLADSVLAVPWIAASAEVSEPSAAPAQVRQLETLVRALGTRDSLRSVLDQALDALVLWTGVERGVLLLKAANGRLVPRAARNLARSDLRGDQLALSQSVAHKALEMRQPVVAVDAAGESIDMQASVHALGLRSVLAVPLIARGDVLGVVYLDDRVRTGAFGATELSWVTLIAVVAAVAIADARDQLLLARSVRRAERAQHKLGEVVAEQQAQIDVISEQAARSSDGRKTSHRYDSIVGDSEAIRSMLALVDRVTPSSVPVLICGESGSGKELVARALHENGPRSAERFVSENCSAIPETLLESTLFGHVRGAFTGADRGRLGLFEAANGGTLFLDEIGEMSLSMQSKMLRVLQDGEVHPLGSARPHSVDVRIVTATHRDLDEMVKLRQFREDLYYRLNVMCIAVPALRERRQDIALLAREFIRRYAPGRQVRVTPQAQRRLDAFDWPGNVRQLENEIRRALVLCDDLIREEHLSPQIICSSDPAATFTLDVRSRVDTLERELVRQALDRTRGNQAHAARLLGLSRFGLIKMCKRLEIGPVE